MDAVQRVVADDVAVAEVDEGLVLAAQEFQAQSAGEVTPVRLVG
jgi:hypothetical protein